MVTQRGATGSAWLPPSDRTSGYTSLPTCCQLSCLTLPVTVWSLKKVCLCFWLARWFVLIPVSSGYQEWYSAIFVLCVTSTNWAYHLLHLGVAEHCPFYIEAPLLFIYYKMATIIHHPRDPTAYKIWTVSYSCLWYLKGQQCKWHRAELLNCSLCNILPGTIQDAEMDTDSWSRWRQAVKTEMQNHKGGSQRSQ